jgi:multicomponent Na+:H+ antiporter subunit C
MTFLFTDFLAKYNYWAFVVLVMIGLYAMIVKKNLVKKIVGMNILQTAVILFYVSTAAKKNATIPIIAHGHGDAAEHAVHAAEYINPLPHVLMLTAIVVGVATTALALSLVVRIHEAYGTIEEDEIREQEEGHG